MFRLSTRNNLSFQNFNYLRSRIKFYCDTLFILSKDTWIFRGFKLQNLEKARTWISLKRIFSRDYRLRSPSLSRRQLARMSTIILLCRARNSRAEVLTRRTVTWSWHILDQSRVTRSCLRIPVCTLLILHWQWSYHYLVSRPYRRRNWIKIDMPQFFSTFFVIRMVLMQALKILRFLILSPDNKMEFLYTVYRDVRQNIFRLDK